MSKAQAARTRFTPEQVQMYCRHFEEYDLNGDGVITGPELSKVSRKLGYRLSEEQIANIMLEHDADKDGCLNFEEFMMAMPANVQNITTEEHELADVRRKFMEYDRDGNGLVTVEEAHHILSKELAFTREQSLKMVNRYDRNGDGRLSYEEFARFYCKVRAKAQVLQKMFAEFDKDKSGTVSLTEAKTMLRKLGMGGDQVEVLVNRYDANGDGELQYYEFVNFLLHT